jgi:hypothetical protein
MSDNILALQEAYRNAMLEYHAECDEINKKSRANPNLCYLIPRPSAPKKPPILEQFDTQKRLAKQRLQRAERNKRKLEKKSSQDNHPAKRERVESQSSQDAIPAPVAVADNSAPVAVADNSAPVAVADNSAPVAVADNSAPVAVNHVKSYWAERYRKCAKATLDFLNSPQSMNYSPSLTFALFGSMGAPSVKQPVKESERIEAVLPAPIASPPAEHPRADQSASLLALADAAQAHATPEALANVALAHSVASARSVASAHSVASALPGKPPQQLTFAQLEEAKRKRARGW